MVWSPRFVAGAGGALLFLFTLHADAHARGGTWGGSPMDLVSNGYGESSWGGSSGYPSNDAWGGSPGMSSNDPWGTSQGGYASDPWGGSSWGDLQMAGMRVEAKPGFPQFPPIRVRGLRPPPPARPGGQGLPNPAQPRPFGPWRPEPLPAWPNGGWVSSGGTGQGFAYRGLPTGDGAVSW